MEKIKRTKIENVPEADIQNLETETIEDHLTTLMSKTSLRKTFKIKGLQHRVDLHAYDVYPAIGGDQKQ